MAKYLAEDFPASVEILPAADAGTSDFKRG